MSLAYDLLYSKLQVCYIASCSNFRSPIISNFKIEIGYTGQYSPILNFFSVAVLHFQRVFVSVKTYSPTLQFYFCVTEIHNESHIQLLTQQSDYAIKMLHNLINQHFLLQSTVLHAKERLDMTVTNSLHIKSFALTNC